MKQEDALSIVQNLIFEVNGTPISDIKLGDCLITDLAMDSVELIDFLIRLEDYDVMLNESEITNSLTVEKIVKMVVKE